MNNEIFILFSTAGFLGFIHTILGPDHYLPFIALSKARKWSWKQTFWVVFLCGLGHVLSSVIIGIVGIALGKTVFHITAIEESRGAIVGWFLIAFGFVYSIWGLRKAFTKKMGHHIHLYSNDEGHHNGTHNHIHPKKEITPWILFVVFVFGPCEPLIPLIMYPGISYNYLVAGIASLVFAITTIGTMMLTTFLGLKGINVIQTQKIEKFMEAIAGFTIFLCGISVQFLNL